MATEADQSGLGVGDGAGRSLPAPPPRPTVGHRRARQVCRVTIRDPLGLHARSALALVDLANRFHSDVRIANGARSADAKSIMQVLQLAAVQGTELTIEADGPDARMAANALHDLVENRLNGS